MASKNTRSANGTDAFADADVSFLKNKSILVTGATGSFGKRFVRRLLKSPASKIIVFSRDELKQSEMQDRIPDPAEKIRYFLGNVRDRDRLNRAFSGVDYVVHAAALKQVPTLEYNPFEAVKTNVMGSQNVIDAAIDSGVSKVLILSTDKAANPTNLYGATKLCSEKLFVAGNSYAARKTRFSVVRYGNVVGSRGSVVPLFLSMPKGELLPITDKRMTRFWITLDQGVNFVLMALKKMKGGEIFVPKIGSMRITDLAEAIAPGRPFKIVGLRPGEKLHEVLVTAEEAPRCLDQGEHYMIQPAFPWWDAENNAKGRPMPKNFTLTSDSNSQWLTRKDLLAMIKTISGR